MRKVKLAILSPSDNNFSETFIKVHKEQIDAQVFFYYNGSVPTLLEGEGEILKTSLGDRARRRFDIGLGPKSLNDTEKALYQSLKKNHVQVVLAEFGTTAAKSLAVIQALNIPLIVHFHGYDAHQKDVVEAHKKKYLEVFDYASAIVVVSDLMRNTLIKLGAPKNKIHLNPCSPNPNFFEIKREQNTDNQVVMFVGRFVEKKAPLKLVEAFELVSQRFPKAKLIMVGDGPFLKKTIKFARTQKLDELTIFPGKLKHNEVKELMSSSFCYAQHSVTATNGDSEGTPVAIMEAAAAGMPIVSTRHAGIQDVITHGETGYLVEEGDSEAMGKYIIELLENRTDAYAMGRKARLHVLENYSQEIAVGVLNELVTKAVQGE